MRLHLHNVWVSLLFFCIKIFESDIFHISQSSSVPRGSISTTPTLFLSVCPPPVFSINLDLSREHVSSPGQRFLRLFLTVWLHSTGPQGCLLTGWAPIHMICLFARRAPAVLEKTRRLQSTTVHCQTAKKKDGQSFSTGEGRENTSQRK